MKHLQKFEGFNDPSIVEITFGELEKFHQEYKIIILEDTGVVDVEINDDDISRIDDYTELLNDVEIVYILISPDQYHSLPAYMKNRVDTFITTEDIIFNSILRNRMELLKLVD